MTLAQLHEALRHAFHCMDTNRSYIEFPVTPPRNGEPFTTRMVPQTIGVAMIGEVEDVEPVLCGWLWSKLLAATTVEQREDAAVMVLMRRWPTIAEFTHADGRQATKLSMRLHVPGLNLQQVFGDACKREPDSEAFFL